MTRESPRRDGRGYDRPRAIDLEETGRDDRVLAGDPERLMSDRLALIEFPADDSDRAQRFWSELLGIELEARADGEGEGWQTHAPGPALGVHERGRGPGDTFSLPYFAVEDLDAALERVAALGGTIIHPGASWAICKDSEGTPFGLAAR